MDNFKTQPEKKSQGIWIIICIVFVIAIVIAVIYFYTQTALKKNTSDPTNNTATTVASPTSTGQVFSDTKFTYTCPADWTLGTNENYNGKVDLSECSKIYSGTMSFDDGVDITFGFVPQTVANSIDSTTGQKYADAILNQVKNESNTQAYANNNFTGFISPENNSHTLALIARYQTNDGYYEVSATAMGNTKTSQQYQQMVNDVISTFKIK